MTNQHDEHDEQQIHVQYWRSPLFRVFHINGVYGGVTPVGEIYMALYVDRHPYPSEVIHSIEDGKLGGEISRKTPSGIEREIQAEVRMSLRQAVVLRDWLDGKIGLLNTLIEEQGGQQADTESPNSGR